MTSTSKQPFLISFSESMARRLSSTFKTRSLTFLVGALLFLTLMAGLTVFSLMHRFNISIPVIVEDITPLPQDSTLITVMMDRKFNADPQNVLATSKTILIGESSYPILSSSIMHRPAGDAMQITLSGYPVITGQIVLVAVDQRNLWQLLMMRF